MIHLVRGLSSALLVASLLIARGAGAATILLVSDVICTDVFGGGTSCSLDVVLPVDTDLISDSNDRFELDVADVVGTWLATIMVGDGITNASSTLGGISAPGNYAVMFSDFAGVDFSALDQVRLTLENASAPGDFIDVARLAAVPEPGTCALVGVGIAGLGALRRGRRVRRTDGPTPPRR